MRLALASLTICLLAGGAAAQPMSDEVCDVTASIVAQAQKMRVAGDDDRRATRKLAREFRDLGEGYTEGAIPTLVGFVYMQPEGVLDQDLSAVWKETCLTTDLSSVLATE